MPAPLQMGEEIAFENGRISIFHGLVTLTLQMGKEDLNLNLGSGQISLKSKKIFVDRRTDGRTFETH